MTDPDRKHAAPEVVDQQIVDESVGLPEGRWWRKPGDRPVVFSTILRKLRARTKGRLLDVGCGQGQFLRRSSRFFDAWGIDISPPRVERARAQSGLNTIIQGSATELPFPNGSFDVVCALDVVEHLPDPRLFFPEARRVMRQDGLLLFSTPNPDSFGHRRKGQRSFSYRDSTHVSVHSVAYWKALVHEHGFEIVRDGTDVLWDPPYFAIVPERLQRIVFLGLAQLLFMMDVIYPWSAGENYWCLAKASAVETSS